jgi:predicted RNA-binding Zn-ribbon protein involved in translation (DUF1610 family)
MQRRKEIRKQLKIFDTQAFGLMDTIWEWCPYCESEVKLPAVMGRYECPECGKKILTCTLCYEEGVNCADCEERINKMGVK